MPKLVFLNPSAQLGGAEKVLLEIVRRLKGICADWQIDLILGGDGPVFEKAVSYGINVRVLPFPLKLAQLGDAGAGGPAGRQMKPTALAGKLFCAAPQVMSYVKQMRRVLKESVPDIIQTNGFKMHLIGAWARPRTVPLIWHVHDYVSMRPLMARFMRRYARQCAAIVANSKSVADDVQAVFGAQVKVRSAFNGIDLDEFSPTGRTLDLDQLAGMPPSHKKIIRVGLPATFARWKGHEVFLRAIASIPKKIPIRGYILGDALYQTNGSQYTLEELRQMASNLNIADRIGFTGFVSDAAAAMRALDIVVHASTQPEPFGLVIAEAMACGRAVIASRTGGAMEIIGTGDGALLCPPGDVSALSMCITQLATNSQLRATLGVVARRRAESYFDSKRMVSELLKLYGEIGL